MEELTESQAKLLNELQDQSARRGWFFLNAKDFQELDDVKVLETKQFIEIEDRDVRIDPISQRIKAGEFVGKVLQAARCR
jgi:hypothetical protein